MPISERYQYVHNCDCGSGQTRRALDDARGIFVAYVCDSCEADKRSKYRPDIFADPNYWTDEPVEADDVDGW